MIYGMRPLGSEETGGVRKAPPLVAVALVVLGTVFAIRLIRGAR